MRYATALAEWGDAGGYDAEVFWDECCTRPSASRSPTSTDRPLRTFSGGEQKRLALEALLRSDYDVLLLDEPDNFLDVPGKRWLEGELRATRKTILYVSHDRELLAATATQDRHGRGRAARGPTAAASPATTRPARRTSSKLRARPSPSTTTSASGSRSSWPRCAGGPRSATPSRPKLKAAESRLRQFLENERAPDARARAADRHAPRRRAHRQAGADHRAASSCDGLTDPFDLEIWFGERVAVLGGNGAGKSHFLRLLAGDARSRTTATCASAPASCPGLFHQTHEHPEWVGRTLLEILHDHDVVRGPAMGDAAPLRAAGLRRAAVRDAVAAASRPASRSCCSSSSGPRCCCSTSRRTTSTSCRPRRSRPGSPSSRGTVVAVTHDRWFLRGFDRFLVFNDDCSVTDHLDRPADARYRSARRRCEQLERRIPARAPTRLPSRRTASWVRPQAAPITRPRGESEANDGGRKRAQRAKLCVPNRCRPAHGGAHAVPAVSTGRGRSRPTGRWLRRRSSASTADVVFFFFFFFFFFVGWLGSVSIVISTLQRPLPPRNRGLCKSADTRSEEQPNPISFTTPDGIKGRVWLGVGAQCVKGKWQGGSERIIGNDLHWGMTVKKASEVDQSAIQRERRRWPLDLMWSNRRGKIDPRGLRQAILDIERILLPERKSPAPTVQGHDWPSRILRGRLSEASCLPRSPAN